MHPTFSASDSEEESRYGLRYLDKTATGSEEESVENEADEEYDEKSCASNCCDMDCECDDCLRCSDTDLKGADIYEVAAAA